MAICFGPLPPSRKQFDVAVPSGRPPRKDFSHRPPRVQRVKTHGFVDEISRRTLSSTYRSFRESNEDDIFGNESHKPFRRTQSLKTPAESSEDHLMSLGEGSTRIRRNRRSRHKSKTLDGYSSDTTLLPNLKPFLSSFKTDDNDFETALFLTFKEKSQSTQNLVDLKKPGISPRLKPVPIPSTEGKLEKNLKRTVKFLECPTEEKRSRFSVLKSELPSETFEDLKKAANTKHPKSLYSTRRYTDLHITIFCGNECVNPAKAEDRTNQNFNGNARNTSSLRHSRRASAVGRRLFRSQSEGNLASTGENGLTLNKCLRALNGSWRNLLNRKCYTI